MILIKSKTDKTYSLFKTH